jgi:hypothetical protein
MQAVAEAHPSFGRLIQSILETQRYGMVALAEVHEVARRLHCCVQ